MRKKECSAACRVGQRSLHSAVSGIKPAAWSFSRTCLGVVCQFAFSRACRHCLAGLPRASAPSYWRHSRESGDSTRARESRGSAWS